MSRSQVTCNALLHPVSGRTFTMSKFVLALASILGSSGIASQERLGQLNHASEAVKMAQERVSNDGFYYFSSSDGRELTGPYPLQGVSVDPGDHAALCFIGQVSYCEVQLRQPSSNSLGGESGAVPVQTENETVAQLEALAQVVSPEPPEPAAQAKPVDADTLEQYLEVARSAVERGDSEAAIVALETILLIAPELDNIRLELGVLYANMARQGSVFASLGEQYDQVGARERAVYYFEKALASNEIPDDIRLNAQQRLDAIRQPGLRGWLYAGSLSAGWQHDTNPSSLSEQVRLFDTFIGAVRTLPNGELVEPDNSYSLSHDSRLQYHLNERSYLEADLSLSLRRFQEVEELNQEFGRLAFGPVFGRFTNSPIRINPFLSADAVRYDGELFQSSVGGGLNFSYKRGPVGTALRVSSRVVDFEGDDERDATLSRLSAELSYRFAKSGFGVSAGVSASNNSAEAESQSYDRAGAEAGLSYTFARGRDSLPVIFNARLGASNTTYSEADVVIDPTNVREDDEQFARFTLEFPFTRSIGLSFYAQRTEKDSSIPNYSFENDQYGLNANWRF